MSAIAVMLAVFSALPAFAAIDTVTNLNDSGPGSLRAEIAAAAPGDTIVFQPGLTGTIGLTSGTLTISQSLTITGPGASLLAISGNSLFTVFTITGGGGVAISGLTVENGHGTFGGGFNITSGGGTTVSNLILLCNSAYEGGDFYINSGGGVSITNVVGSGEFASSGTGSVLFNAGGGGGISINLSSFNPFQCAAFTDAYQVHYAANLTTLGDSLIDLTNTGASASTAGQLGFSDGNICANVYVFDPSEEELDCCSCQITPNALQSMSVKALLSTNLTPEKPNSAVIKILASQPVGGTCDPTTAGVLVHGLRAWETNLHQSSTVPNITYATETEFAGSILSPGELNRLTNLCAFIRANGSGNGQCGGCPTPGGQ